MKQRIYRNYFWVALTTILIVSFVFVFSYNRTIHDQKEEGMREEAEFISALLEKQGDADVGFQAAAGKTDFRITLIAENGMVLYDNKVKDVSGMENHAKRPEILKASKNGEGSSSRISSTIQSETYYYARKLSDGRYLRLSSEGLSIWSGFVQVLPALTGIALFVIFITFLIAHFLTRNIVEAINGIDLENPMEKVVFPELGVLLQILYVCTERRYRLRTVVACEFSNTCCVLMEKVAYATENPADTKYSINITKKQMII